jgi:hypothetical protein
VTETTTQSVNLKLLLEGTIKEQEPAVPYPQANDLDKVIGVLTNFHSADLSNKQAIADFYKFEGRQGDYYANAGVYLGLLQRVPSSTKFILTKNGENIARSENLSQRNLLLLKEMLKRPSLYAIIALFEKNNRDSSSLNIDVLTSIIRKYRQELNSVTGRRRASAIKNWLRWIETL